MLNGEKSVKRTYISCRVIVYGQTDQNYTIKRGGTSAQLCVRVCACPPGNILQGAAFPKSIHPAQLDRVQKDRTVGKCDEAS